MDILLSSGSPGLTKAAKAVPASNLRSSQWGVMNGSRNAPAALRDMMMRRDVLDRGDYDMEAKRARRY
ncbi:hypothetical protein MRX96_004315 [Rhipicephalus microplus]